ncbi:MAG: Uma2 family endonuclease [Cyanobacteria bacterium]|nr:Uma2 family endonuclease [Cyanobacteriota bacterium]
MTQSLVSTGQIDQPLEITFDRWQPGTWEDFTAIAEEAENDGRNNLHAYYQDGWMRFEMTPLGPEHARQNFVPLNTANLYASFRNLSLRCYINPSMRKRGEKESQPDLAFYIGRDLKDLPTGNAPIDLDAFDPPSLVVEVGASSFADDIGMKRLLYERIGVGEYWVVNVEARSVIGFAIADGGSRAIQTSQVLPGLELSIITEALQRLDREDDGQITRWLIHQFQGN